jgi:hypothetical protein
MAQKIWKQPVRNTIICLDKRQKTSITATIIKTKPICDWNHQLIKIEGTEGFDCCQQRRCDW